MRTTRTAISTGWRVRELLPGTGEPGTVDWIPAEVPGHIHLDLMRAGVIPDPLYRMSERACAWVDEADWEYETTFEVEDPAPTHAYLRFNGLDTIAEIYLNDTLLAETDNMFIEHEFPVGTGLEEARSVLQAGANTLRVIFRSALRTGRKRQQAWHESQRLTPDTQPPTPHKFVWGPRSFVRKAQYMYGWDWGPELVSCGIWKPVELIIVPTARILNWASRTEFQGEDALLYVDVDIVRADSAPDVDLTLEFALSGPMYIRSPKVTLAGLQSRERAKPSSISVPPGSGTITLQAILKMPAAERWRPSVLGPGEEVHSAPFYRLYLHLKSADATVHVLREQTVGLRTIELVQEPIPGEFGRTFKLRINGEDTFVKGANWIPAHSFPSRRNLEVRGDEVSGIRLDERRLVRAAWEAGLNMLRVWGGGLYESDDFYEACNRNGILVWQDFGYGCAYYPDTEEYAARAEAEARAAVRRLRNHPSLVVWCGNNECHQVWHDHWEGKEKPAPRFLGERLYHEILPRVVAEEDPGRPYWPGSPFGGENPNSEDEGDRHNWNVWHGAGDWVHYLEDRGRFISEFGFASSCGLNAWEKCLAESDKHPYSPAVRWHDKTRKGYEKYLELVKLHFPEPATLEDLVYYTQLNQAEALKCGIEHWRRSKGRCWGTLFWQLNDCWPVQSWSVIDSELEPKAAYFAVKRAYAPVLLSLVRKGDEVEAHLTSDLREKIQGDVIISVESFDGEVLMDERFEAYVEENGTPRVGGLDVATFHLHRRDVYVYARFDPYWDLGLPAPDNYLFLAEPKDLRLADPGLTAEIAEGAGILHLTLNAQRFAPYVWWRFDGIRNTTGEDNHFHLRAAQSRVISLDRSSPAVEELQSRLRLRSL